MVGGLVGWLVVVGVICVASSSGVARVRYKPWWHVRGLLLPGT